MGNLNAAGLRTVQLVDAVTNMLHMFRFHFVKRKCHHAQFQIVTTGPEKQVKEELLSSLQFAPPGGKVEVEKTG